MLKKVTFKNSRDLNLMGHLYTAESETIIIMCHGFTGDKFELGRFTPVAESLNKTGYNVLAFDFSGSGESDDDSLTVDKQIDDLKCAIKYSEVQGFKKFGIFAHSLGGLISLRCVMPKIEAMFLWAPVTDTIKYAMAERFTAKEMQELSERGIITHIVEEGFRKIIIIDKQMTIDRANVNQQALLKNVNCPVHIIHGKLDEMIPYTDSQEAIKLLSSQSKLTIVDDADHGFFKQVDLLIENANEWFLKFLPIN